EELAAATASEPGTPPPHTPPPAAPRPTTQPGVVYGAPAAPRASREKRSRGLLYAAIAVASLALGVAVWWVLSRPSASARPTVPPAVAAAALAPPGASAPTPLPAAPTPVPTVAAAYDPKAVEAEVQRQLALKKKELQKASEANPDAPAGKAPGAAAPAATPAVRAKDDQGPAPVETPAPPKAEPTAVAPQPTAVPTLPTPGPPPAEP